MKRPAIVIVVMYFAALLVLTAPVIVAAFWSETTIAGIVRDVFKSGFYWTFLAVMVAGQAALLVVPVKVTSRRPVSRRSLFWPIIAAGLMAGLMVVGVVAAVSEFAQRDHAFDSNGLPWPALAFGALIWVGWSVAFYRVGRGANAQDVVSRQCRLLLTGSVLELLVAIPTHIVARSRGYCCAGAYTFVGIALGITVMLMSFGPAVFFLYVDRWRRLHPTAALRG